MLGRLRVGLVLVALCGCDRAAATPLVELSGISPKRVEDGDKLEIEGASLPEGREAHVVFRGTLHRPGDAAETLELASSGRVVARDRIEVAVTPAWIAAMTGERRLHTTFRGSVEVVFAAQIDGAPPVSGLVEHAEIDVIADGTLGRDPDEGKRALAAIGVSPAEPRFGEGLGAGVEIVGVEPGSRAARAGLQVGDRLVSFAGVRVLSIADVALVAAASSIEMSVSHGATAPDETVVVDTEGLAPSPRSRVAIGLLLAALAAAAVIANKSPLARLLAWLERRLSGSPDSAGTGGSTTAVVASLIGAAVTFPLARPLFGARVELPVVAATVLIASAALTASRALRTGELLRAWATELLRALPLIAAVAVVGLRHGSLTAQDAIREQGAWPWQWTVSRTPMGVVLLALMLASWSLPPTRDASHHRRHDAAAVFGCAIAATSLLGGWSTGSPPMILAGTCVFIAKTGLLFLLTRRLCRAIPAVTTRAWASRVLPLSLAAVGFELACQRLHVTSAAGLLTCAVALALAMLVALRARRLSRGHTPRGHASVVL